jgi:hypothetical protein
MRKAILKTVISSVAICVAAAIPSWAADGTWVGGVSTDLCEPLNWSDGVLPTDNAAISLKSSEILTCSGTFSPKSITFLSDSAKVTIEGEGEIVGILAVTNKVNQHHIFNIPVTFAQGVEADISVHSANYMDFAGGMTAYTIKRNGTEKDGSDYYRAYYCGKITLLKEYEDWDTATTSDIQNPNGTSKKDYLYVTGSHTVLTLPGAENSGRANFNLRDGATLLVNGDFRLTRKDLKLQNPIIRRCEGTPGGTVKVTGKVVSSNAAHGAPFCYDTNGKFVVGGIENGSSYVFMLHGFNTGYNNGATPQTAKPCNWWIGANGITGHNGTESNVRDYAFHTFGHQNAQAIITAISNFSIDAVISLGAGSSLTFNTTNPESGEGHTITDNAVLSHRGKITIKGVGQFLFNSVSTFDGGLTVNDSATVAVKTGCRPGNGAVTLNNTSTLKVAQSGTVTLGGNLTLAATASLAFNFTEKKTAPQLALASGKTANLPETVNVKLSANEGISPSSSQTHTLTSAFNFTGKTVNLVNPPEWVKSVDIVDGNLVLTVKPEGFVFFVR